MDAAPIEAVVGLLALAWVFEPGFRALIFWMFIFAVVIGVIALVVFIVWKIRSGQSQALSKVSIGFSWPTAGPAKPKIPTQDLRSAFDDTRYQPPLSGTFVLPLTEPAQPAIFTPELLSALEWRRFEILVTLFFQRTGYEAQRNSAGADGGVDIFVRHPGESQPSACVQCKAWNKYTVGVKPVRELYGVMAADKIPHGFFVTTGDFTSDAIQFARDKSLVLVNGADLIKDLNGLPEATRKAILEEITGGDYSTPTCPRCDIKMTERRGPTGLFWGCVNYPRCHQTFRVRSDQE